MFSNLIYVNNTKNGNIAIFVWNVKTCFFAVPWQFILNYVCKIKHFSRFYLENWIKQKLLNLVRIITAAHCWTWARTWMCQFQNKLSKSKHVIFYCDLRYGDDLSFLGKFVKQSGFFTIGKSDPFLSDYLTDLKLHSKK